MLDRAGSLCRNTRNASFMVRPFNCFATRAQASCNRSGSTRTLLSAESGRRDDRRTLVVQQTQQSAKVNYVVTHAQTRRHRHRHSPAAATATTHAHSQATQPSHTAKPHSHTQRHIQPHTPRLGTMRRQHAASALPCMAGPRHRRVRPTRCHARTATRCRQLRQGWHGGRLAKRRGPTRWSTVLR